MQKYYSLFIIINIFATDVLMKPIQMAYEKECSPPCGNIPGYILQEWPKIKPGIK